RGAPARPALAVAACLAPVATCNSGLCPGRDLEHDAARRELHPRRRRSDGQTVLLVRGGRLPPRPPATFVSRRGGRHGGPLARRLSPGGSHPARARLVPAG